ncbi:Rossmann-fold NAD(P)-binding domain-containing protein [Microlunatus parietis]|uniref:Uncharacterized protein n=1 Tax=Microlunatus parietis TaxID=682979 RepID=A0A7Y9LFG1_9ACTN|nr:hypothetical protein [Microlunatus parietis]NYE74940.1 hypothetical protein [Microlunatus parietis]
MDSTAEVLTSVSDILLHNWPKEDVPDTLVRAGYTVTVYGGPEPDDIFVHELGADDTIEIRRTGRPPERADLVYVFPWPTYTLAKDLPWVADQAGQLGARWLWYQSGRFEDGTTGPEGCWLPDDEAGRVRSIVEGAGLMLIMDPYLPEAVRTAGARR